jgi:hypothetical protein
MSLQLLAIYDLYVTTATIKYAGGLEPTGDQRDGCTANT